MTSHNTSTTGILDNNPYSEENKDKNKTDDRHQSHESKTVEDKTDINKNSQIKIKNKFHRSTETRISNKNFVEKPEETVKISNTNKTKLQFQQPATKNNDVHNILHGNKLQLANNAENNNKFQTQNNTQILRSSNNSKNSICSAKHVTHFSALLKPVLSIPAKKKVSKQPNYQIPAVDFDENTTEDFTSAIFWGAGFCSFFVHFCAKN